MRKKILLLIRELGVGVALLYLVDRLLRKLSVRSGFFYYRFMAQALGEHRRLPSSRGRAFAFRLLQSPEPALMALGHPLSAIEQRFTQGAQCLMATRSDALVGCIWFVHKAYLEDEVRVDYLLPAKGHCVWDFDVFVHESERMGFLFAKQWDTFDALLRPRGVRYTISRVNAFNQRSLSSHQSLGAKDCGWALFLRLGALQWMLSSQRPYFSVGGRPRLHMFCN